MSDMYQPTGERYTQQDTRSMSFMISETAKYGPAQTYLPGCRHDLIISPKRFNIEYLTRDAVTPIYGGYFHEKHPSKFARIYIAGSCGRKLRDFSNYQVDGISILRSLQDLFLSNAGFYQDPENPDYYIIRGANTTYRRKPDEIELRWYNWGHNIDSGNSKDLNYWRIVQQEKSFSIDWQEFNQIPTYKIQFLAVEEMSAPASLRDEIEAFFDQNNVFPNALNELANSDAWSWTEQLNTKMYNKMAKFYREMFNLRLAMMRQRQYGGDLPYNYGNARTAFDEFENSFQDIF